MHDGRVPDSVPTTTGGFIQPYLAVWTEPLREHDEQPLDYSKQETAGALTVTAAGATAGTVRNLSQEVILKLHRAPAPGGGEYRHVEPFLKVQTDNQISPARLYLPLSFEFQQP
ncbi:hypothetical protein [Brevibacterium sp. CT2-23B]|uniref:hypothetical protein n=1 Tax=Brevibacterium sp. CT2-23B TaxID=2729630 RepID=UPI001554E881|nr:hypothetical protein [Brevibacterium sp. CT2-23B]